MAKAAHKAENNLSELSQYPVAAEWNLVAMRKTQSAQGKDEKTRHSLVRKRDLGVTVCGLLSG